MATQAAQGDAPGLNWYYILTRITQDRSQALLVITSCGETIPSSLFNQRNRAGSEAEVWHPDSLTCWELLGTVSHPRLCCTYGFVPQSHLDSFYICNYRVILCTFWYNLYGLDSSSIGQSVPRATYRTDTCFWVRVSKGSDVTCRFCVCSCVCPQYCICWRCKQQSEVNDCDAKSWPHVASLRPSHLTCGLHLHLNTLQIYWLLWNGCKHEPRCHFSFRPFGCIYSVTVLQGHRRVFNGCYGALFISSWSDCVKVTEDKGIERDFAILPNLPN